MQSYREVLNLASDYSKKTKETEKNIAKLYE